jgi:hypothetical protein
MEIEVRPDHICNNHFRKMANADIIGSVLTGYVYAQLDALRTTSGKLTRIILGSREAFAHQAALDVSHVDVYNGMKIFPESITEEFPQTCEQHHPFLHFLNERGLGKSVDIKILPGETYEILQDGDEQVVRIIKGQLRQYPPPTKEQIEMIDSLYEVKE